MSDEARLPDPTAAASRLPRGSGVILRHYASSHRDTLANDLAQLCKRRGLALFVGEDWRLAARVGADGVHLPARALAAGLPAGARLWLRRRRARLTIAAHGERDLRRAAAMHADAVLLSPVFRTTSHPDKPA
ncbi:MAG: thiamine phosphate synthase, partial [Rhodospirillaceae bacterium]